MSALKEKNVKAVFPSVKPNVKKPCPADTDPQILNILDLISGYVRDSGNQEQLQLLLKIYYLAQLNKHDVFIETCVQELDAYTAEAFDSSESIVWPYLAAFRPIAWAEVNFDIPAGYELLLREVLEFAHKDCIGKSSRIAEFIEEKIAELKAKLLEHQKRYDLADFNYLFLESMNNYQASYEILIRLIESISKIKPKYQNQYWALIEKVATWAATAEVYYKGLNHPECTEHRRVSLTRKDLDNAKKDAPRFIEALKSHPEFQQNLELLDDIYTLERLFNDFKEYDDQYWYLSLTSLLSQQLNKYLDTNKLSNQHVLRYIDYLSNLLEDLLKIEHGCDQANMLVFDKTWSQMIQKNVESCLEGNLTVDAVEDEQNQQCIRTLFRTRRLLSNLEEQQSDSQVGHEFNDLPTVEGGITITKLRSNDLLTEMRDSLSQMVEGKEQSGVEYFLSEIMPGAQIQRIGGIEPRVYRIKCRDDTWLLLRLFTTDIDLQNRQAIDVLQKLAPEFVGKNYYRSDAFGDYTYCECSEFFAAGSLDSYIKQLDHTPSGKLTIEQQRLLFTHFKQVLTVMAGLHHERVYFPDAKPSNFLFDEDPLKSADAKLVLSDLKSLWTFDDDAHKRGRDVISCTPDYTAPEIINNIDEEIHPFAQDYYGLGMTFLEYLTGTTDRAEIEQFQPRDHFEAVMKSVLQRLIMPEAKLRVQYGDYLMTQLDALEKKLFESGIKSDLAANFGAMLFARQQVEATIPHHPQQAHGIS